MIRIRRSALPFNANGVPESGYGKGFNKFLFRHGAYKTMTLQPSYQTSSLGDSALLIQFSNTVDGSINRKVLSLFKQLKDANFPFTDIVPAYSSIAVRYDVLKWRSKQSTAFDNVKAALEPFLAIGIIPDMGSPRRVAIP